LQTCWYSLDSGATNTSITCGNNVSGLSTTAGNSYTWNVYANDSLGNLRATSVSFSHSSGGSDGDSGGGGGGSTTPAEQNQTCIESWSCGEWSRCISGRQTRTCIDLNSCGTTQDKPEELRSCICIPDWVCGEWSVCINNEQFRACYDNNFCGTTQDKPENSKICEDVKYTDWSCSDWGECEAHYTYEDIINENPIVPGKMKKICQDKDGQSMQIIYIDCDYQVPIEAKKVEWCYQNFVEIYDVNSKKLVSRLRQTSSSGWKKIDIGFIETEFKGYCDYCFNNIQDYDETGVDCGGENCPICEEPSKFFLPKILIIIFLLILIDYLSYLYKKQGEKWM